jgi:hypothetical protein
MSKREDMTTASTKASTKSIKKKSIMTNMITEELGM